MPIKLGVFDSGIGGEAIAASLKEAFREEATILTVNDCQNVPYGNKTSEEIIRLTEIAIQPLLAASCDIIILACNTVTAVAIETLRLRYPQQKFIGIEPMVKTAATLTKTHIIAVCATPATLASSRYRSLIKTHAPHLTILEPDCSDWAYKIEHDQVDRQAIEQIVLEVCGKGADVIVLGCTHYHWIKDLITQLASGRATVIEPSDAIGRRVRQLLRE